MLTSITLNLIRIKCIETVAYLTPHWEFKYYDERNYSVASNISFHKYEKDDIKNGDECVVISLAYSYSFEDINYFILSLRNYYEGNIVFFIKEDEYLSYAKYLDKYKLQLINITYNSPFYSNKNTKYFFNKSELEDIPHYSYKNYWPTYRWFIFNKWLSKYGSLYKYYLICDVRDVIFQDNPFNWNMKEGIYFAEQTRGFEISQNQPNTEYIFYYKYGYKYVDNLLLNAGVVFGTRDKIIHFYKQFSFFLKNRFINTIDQAALNYYLYSYGYNKRFAVYICQNENGPIRTLHIDFMLNKSNAFPRIDNYIYNRDDIISSQNVAKISYFLHAILIDNKFK